MSIRWCGTRARTAWEGFAVPISSPRYTSAESALTISTPPSSASFSAHSVLPAPVGPVRTRSDGEALAAGSALTLTAAQEQPVELLQRQARPGRTAVIALVGALGRLHLPQQRVHLRDAQAPIRVDGTAAGERPEEAVGRAVEVMPGAGIEREIAHQLAHDRSHIRAVDQGRHAS